MEQERELRKHFNPRSHEGSDQIKNDIPTVLRDFNPRSHEGSNDNGIFAQTSGALISIHAPTRGATPTADQVYIIDVLFQSTLPRGERRRNG